MSKGTKKAKGSRRKPGATVATREPNAVEKLVKARGTLAERIEADGGIEAVLDRVRGGDKLKDIAATYGFSKGNLWSVLNKPDNRDAYMEALEQSAWTRVEKAEEILFNDGEPPATAAEARWLSDRAKHEIFVAARVNPFWREEGASVVVNQYAERGVLAEVLRAHHAELEAEAKQIREANHVGTTADEVAEVVDADFEVEVPVDNPLADLMED